ncbi:MAG: sugar ABC transporter permease [Clostridia bacterium]|nr:sugar ABC transporter permease [Clostridia bacterium]
MKTEIKTEKKKNKVMLRQGVRKEVLGLMLLLPALASILLFKYFPIVLGVFETFFKMNIVKLPGEFIGFDNYIRAFTDKQFLGAFLHNAKAFCYSLCMNFWVPIVLAMLVDEARRGKTIFRLLYFIPACAPSIAMTVLWKFFWQPDYGLANYILSIFGIPGQMWLNSESWVYFCIYFPHLVISGGMNLVIYLAALQDVPGELYEAALVDGVGIFNRIRYITIPCIKHIIILMLTLSIINAFNLMENIMILTGGGPSNSTQTMLLYAYQQGVNSMDYSYAMTMTTIIFIVTMTLTVVFNKVTREKD